MAFSGPGLGSRTRFRDLTNFDFSTLTITREPEIPTANCNVCGDLNFRPTPCNEEYVGQPFQREIKPEDLVLRANKGCEACQLLSLSIHRWLKNSDAPTTKTLDGIENLVLHSGSAQDTLVIWIDYASTRATEYLEMYTPEGG
jgi:hypothetical protein